MHLIAAAGESIATAPETIVYLPEGRTTISATVDGRPQTVDVEVGPESLEALQRDLESRNEQNVRPIVDFDHRDDGPAAAIPRQFRYEAGRGVLLDLEWTRAGRSAIEGRDYSYFSPLFIADDSGRPVGLDPLRPIGGLVNSPAFREIQRIAAKAAANETNKVMMDLSKLVEASAITEEEATGEDAVSAIAAAFARKTEELNAAEAKLKATERVRDEALQEIAASKQSKADEAVQRAVEAGRLSANDEEGQKFWSDLIVEKGAEALRQLEAKAAINPGISKPIVAAGGAATPNSETNVLEAKASAIRNRAAEIQKSQGLDFSRAWRAAAAESV
jgi:phage I-like protein